MCERGLRRRFHYLFALITILFLLSSCGQKLELIDSIFDEQTRLTHQYLYLASPKISTTREIEVKSLGCYGFSHLAITETTLAPDLDSAVWQACVNAATVYTYQFNTATIGDKTIYLHTRLGATVNPIKKSIKLTYAPQVVIGLNTINDITSFQRSLYTPNGLNTSGSDLWVTDYQNSRILKYNSVPTANTPAPDFILGQPSYKTFTQNYGGVSAYSLAQPLHSFISGSKLIVADYNNNRVLIWNTVPTTYNTPADVVLGQSNFTSVAPNPNGVSSTSLRRPQKVFPR